MDFGVESPDQRDRKQRRWRPNAASTKLMRRGPSGLRREFKVEG
jgi:hypothetical protein